MSKITMIGSSPVATEPIVLNDNSPQWISVKDQLPDKYARVLITDGKIICLHYKQSGWNFEGDEGSDLYPESCEIGCKHYCGIEEGTITHWLPLPSLPGDEK